MTSAQSALNGNLRCCRPGADVGENMCWWTSFPRQWENKGEEILTRYHSRKKKIRVNITSSVSIKKKKIIPKYKLYLLNKCNKLSGQKSFLSIIIQTKKCFSVNLISIQCYFSTIKNLQSGIIQILACSDFQSFWNTHHCQSLIQNV